MEITLFSTVWQAKSKEYRSQWIILVSWACIIEQLVFHISIRITLTCITYHASGMLKWSIKRWQMLDLIDIISNQDLTLTEYFYLDRPSIILTQLEWLVGSKKFIIGLTWFNLIFFYVGSGYNIKIWRWNWKSQARPSLTRFIYIIPDVKDLPVLEHAIPFEMVYIYIYCHTLGLGPWGCNRAQRATWLLVREGEKKRGGGGGWIGEAKRRGETCPFNSFSSPTLDLLCSPSLSVSDALPLSVSCALSLGLSSSPSFTLDPLHFPCLSHSPFPLTLSFRSFFSLPYPPSSRGSLSLVLFWVVLKGLVVPSFFPTMLQEIG